MKNKILLLAIAVSMILGMKAQEEMAEFRTWAITPPMGWNSWDCYYSSVTEDIVLQNAAYMRDHLKDYGWEYVVVDIRWYANHPSLGGGNYNQRGTQDCVLDEYGRYLPSSKRFPSVMVDGKNCGFKVLADKIHDMGLKFGIHIMRGLPKYILNNRSAYQLKGGEGVNWSQVYSSTTPACTWLQDNLTIRNNSYGQMYYNSIIELYASWGVDFIKVDDIARPFYTNEIKMLRKAIDQCGRPIVLSLSPGKTQYAYAKSCLQYANMWRMMDDLWDNWSSVQAVFAEAHEWSKYQQPGNYADCDMLPLGQIGMTIADNGYCGADAGRWTRLTRDEQYTMMTLWGICHSPLFFGGELTKNDVFTNSLLTNRDYLKMHAHCRESKQLSRTGGQIVWTAIDPLTRDRYLALFSVDAEDEWVDVNKALYCSPVIRASSKTHSQQVEVVLPEGTRTLALVVDNGGDNWNYDHGDWINPTFISKNGYEVQVTGKRVTKKYTNSFYNTINENRNVTNNGKMKVDGVTYDRGFASDANTLMVISVPDSIVGFKAICAADDSGTKQSGATTSVRFLIYTFDPLEAGGDFTVDLTQLGYATNEAVTVFDIWQQKMMGSSIGMINATVPHHGAKLFRLKAPRKVQDVNGDNKVDSQDVLQVYEYIQQTTSEVTYSTFEDVNHDGLVDSQDVLNIYNEMLRG